MASIPNLTPEILSYLQNGSSEPLLEEDVVLILRSSHAGGFSSGGFQWPPEGPVEAKDWNPEPICGYGLHGFKWGEGDGSLAKWECDAVWQVVAVSSRDLVNLNGKVKFPKGWVMYSGNLEEAIRRIAESAPHDAAIIGRIASVGDGESITVGYGGKATAGHNGRATAGHNGIAHVGEGGIARVEHGGVAIAGHNGSAIAGYGGKALVGNNGRAQAGENGHAQAGDNGFAHVGEGGIARAGVGGKIFIAWWDDSSIRVRYKIGSVGEDGILPNVWYRVGFWGNFLRY